MMEQLLNLAWVAVAIASFAMVLPRRRDLRAVGALAFALCLLFPIISATDDMTSDRALEDGLAVLAAFVIAFLLIVVARLFSEPQLAPALAIAPKAGTRAPPRR